MTYSAEYEHLLDCFARWMAAHPERGREMWEHYSDPNHRNYRSDEWRADMSDRILAARRAQGDRIPAPV